MQCNPNEAEWLLFLVIGRDISGGTETDYLNLYFKGEIPRPKDHIPDGWELIESHIDAIVR